MTQDELDALPIMGGIDERIEVRDGRKVVIPVMRKAFALFDPTVYTDANGARWMVGTHEGVMYRREMSRLG